MSAVVSDTSPINYLIRLGEIELLPLLFGEVLIPPAVLQELQDAGAPDVVREWAFQIPPWRVSSRRRLSIGRWIWVLVKWRLSRSRKNSGDTLLLMDERKGRKAAWENGVRTAGTLNILEEAAVRGLLDFEQTVARLRATNFRIKNSVLAEFVARARARRE